MNNDKLLELAREAGKSAKSEADFAELRQQLMKATIEATMSAELDDHLAVREIVDTQQPQRLHQQATANRRGGV